MEGHFHGYHESIYIGGQVAPEQLEANRMHAVAESAGIPDEFTSLDHLHSFQRSGCLRPSNRRAWR